MKHHTAVIALYPGIDDAPYCTLWVQDNHNTLVRGPVDTDVPTSDPGRQEKAALQADTLLLDAGYARTEAWATDGYSLQAPVARARRR